MDFNNWMQMGKNSLNNLNDGSFDSLQSFVESKQKIELIFEDNEVDDIEVGEESGLGISAIRGNNTNYFCYSNPDSCRNDRDTLQSLLQIDQPKNIDFSEPVIREMPLEDSIDTMLHQRKIEKLQEANETARNYDDRIEHVRVSYSEKKRRIAVIDRAGWIRVEPQEFLQCKVLVIGCENGKREKGYGRLAGYQGEVLFDEKSPTDLAEEACNQAITSLEAESVDSGPQTVVIASGFGGTIFHEACGHGFEADHIHEDVSQYAGRMGEKVASDLITFVDDGSRDNLFGAFRMDDEGVSSSKNTLIRDGVMRGIMSDRKYANLLDIKPTGNGRRESFHYPTLPRMTNTYIEAGETSPDDIIEDTENGIYAAHIGGGQVDPASGDFIFSVTEGYKIKDGEITSPIRDAALVGNGPEVLKRVDAVGNDLEFKPGICGKGQWVPVTVGQPTLRVQDLKVGGEGT